MHTPHSNSSPQKLPDPQLHRGLPAPFSFGKLNWRVDKVQVPGTAIMGVQQKHLEAKLRGESSARAGAQGREFSWWAFRQRAEMWMLPQCWKQCMNKIPHHHSSPQISVRSATDTILRACLLKSQYQRGTA